MLLAGVIHHLVPRATVEKLLGKNSSVATAAIIGAPLPLCSCSVIPVAMGIRRSGASKASTASFLVATPETGVDSVGITYALMGPVMAIARPISAIVSAIITGISIALFGNEVAVKEQEEVKSSCCCKSKQAQTNVKPSWRETSMNIVTYGFDKLLGDFMKWLMIGLFFAALIVTFVPNEWMAEYGNGPLAMILMILISIPMYICATASTPIAVGLMMAGISPGAALVFMLTGPATNIATLMVIKQELGNKELTLYLLSLVSSALLCGLLLDKLITLYGWKINLTMGEHGDMQSLIYQISGVILAILMARLVFKQCKKKYFKSLATQ